MPHKQVREVLSRDELDQWLAHPDRAVAVQEVDLSGYEQAFSDVPLSSCLFLGCTMSDALAGYLVSRRSVVIPPDWNFEFQVHRASLYSVQDLFEGFDPEKGDFGNFDESYDQRVYRQYVDQGRMEAAIDVTLARRLHDHSITDARNDFVDSKRVVAIMGGHDLIRGAQRYQSVARLARRLTRGGYTLTSGGGPGAMEATHVGAYFAPLGDDALEQGLEMLGQRTQIVHEDREYMDRDWLQRAFRVRKRFPLSDHQQAAAQSLAIPTWFYGHEPPAPFATHIAKYFCNSVREDGLLQIATRGVIFTPGNAGTVQEIFQDAAQNYYETFHHASPMILLDSEYWCNERPAWDLVKALANTPGKSHMVAHVHLVDRIDEAIQIIESFDPPASPASTDHA